MYTRKVHCTAWSQYSRKQTEFRFVGFLALDILGHLTVFHLAYVGRRRQKTLTVLLCLNHNIILDNMAQAVLLAGIYTIESTLRQANKILTHFLLHNFGGVEKRQ